MGKNRRWLGILMIINNTVINKHLTKARFYKNFNGYLQQDESSNLFMLKSPIMIEGLELCIKN